tara:strand:- start:1055 stop:1483 length:429 start_codon:yes stop_codon:yes gene_type:complete
MAGSGAGADPSAGAIIDIEDDPIYRGVLEKIHSSILWSGDIYTDHVDLPKLLHASRLDIFILYCRRQYDVEYYSHTLDDAKELLREILDEFLASIHSAYVQCLYDWMSLEDYQEGLESRIFRILGDHGIVWDEEDVDDDDEV